MDANSLKIPSKAVKKMFLLAFLLLLSAILGCSSISDFKETKILNNTNLDIDAIKNSLTPLDFSHENYPPVSLIEYYKFYSINYANIPHYFGSFRSNGEIIAAHIFIPENSIGTVFLLHGHNGHSADFKFLIEFLLNYHFAVAVYDLPGHGLSTGQKSSINDFSDYVVVLNDFINSNQRILPKPFHLIGHSTGCAIAFEYICNSKVIAFDKVVFLAPLVRNANWLEYKAGYHLGKYFVKEFPTSNNPSSSSDTAITNFLKNDPLQNHTIPIKFLEAFYAWENKLEKYNKSSKKIFVIQGTCDSIVDWRYSIDFFRDKLETVDIVLIGNARHNLINESKLIREKVFMYLMNFLQDTKPQYVSPDG